MTDDVYWIAVDAELPIAMWNKNLGVYASAGWTWASLDRSHRDRYLRGEVDYCMLAPNPSARGAPLSPFQLGVSANYVVEYNAEVARHRIDPTLPSRLSATFAFGSKKDAVKAAKAAARPAHEVHAFKLERDELTRVHKANMDVISVMRRAARISNVDVATNEEVWRHYWTGGAELEIELPSEPGFGRKLHRTGVQWEYIIDGRLVRLDRRH